MAEEHVMYANDHDTHESEHDEDTMLNKFLTFTLDNEEYGIEISNAIEIIGLQQITAVPHTPPYIKGIVNLRGSVIPVLDVRTRFHKSVIDYNDRACIVVVDFEGTVIGLVADGVSDVVTIPQQFIQAPPNAKSDYHNRYIKNVGKVGDSVKLLLDLGRLLFDDGEL